MQDEEETWCAAQRDQVIAYLGRQQLVHGQVGEWPAWHVHPLVAVWAIESARPPGWVGWWAISGDCPTDYVECGPERTPREAVRDIGMRWREAARSWAVGKSVENLVIGDQEEQARIAPLLEARATTLLTWAADDRIWK